MKLYKLTNQEYQTYNNTQWGEGIEHTAPGGRLCTDQVLHAYSDPNLAILFNPIHSDLNDPILWECDGDVCVNDGMKVGCTRLRTIKQIPLPVISPEIQVKFAILCAAQVPQSEKWLIWARNWWDGSKDAAFAAANANADTYATTYAANNVDAANAATYAANANANAAAYAANATYADTYAANAAAYAAYAAAACAVKKIPFLKLFNIATK